MSGKPRRMVIAVRNTTETCTSAAPDLTHNVCKIVGLVPFLLTVLCGSTRNSFKDSLLIIIIR